MNKYIKKCLLVYVSMAVVLCGMVGVTYAITATDADQYVTRSQYAVDMAHLQNQLDEAEAGLMGSINRYRSTDVKFVTWDTPTKWFNTTGWAGGRYNGGNYGGRPKLAGGSYCYPGVGIANSNANPVKREGRYTDYSIFRLYNGNYYITKNIYMNNQASSPVMYYQTLNYAVPVENFPGWYIVMRMNYHNENYVNSAMSLVKLDPNATGTPTQADTLQIRLKKDLFVYAGANSTPVTTTKRTANSSMNYYYNHTEASPFNVKWRSDVSRTGTHSTVLEGWLDESTGDYIQTIRGIQRCYADSSAVYNYCYYFSPGNTAAAPLSVLMPADNVEYLSGNILGYYNLMESTGNRYTLVAGAIGTGYFNDPYWRYEFVDCDNGIKYWHAYRPASTTALGGGGPLPVTIHYSLPVVY